MDMTWGTRVINVYRDTDTFFTLESGVVYDMDVDGFRLALKELETSEDGIVFPDAHRHNTTVTLGTLVLARVVEIINGFTVQFWPDDSHWTANILGANNNIDVVKATGVDFVDTRQNNSAGLIVGPGADAADIASAVWSHLIEGVFTTGELFRIIASAVAGKTSGAATATITFRDISDTKDRIVMDTDASGNRDNPTYDGT